MESHKALPLDEEFEVINDFWEANQSSLGTRPWQIISFQVVSPKQIYKETTLNGHSVLYTNVYVKNSGQKF